MNFDKDGKKLIIFGFKYYSFLLKSLFFSQIIILAIIAGFSEVPEIVRFGYELGVFFAPISSSIIIGLLVHFFTTHLEKTMYWINSYRVLETYFEGPRRAIKNIFLSFSENKETAQNFDFNCTNLNESLYIEFSKKIISTREIFAYNGINDWHHSNLEMVISQFYNDLNNRYKFESIDLDPNIKRRYLDIATVIENNIIPQFNINNQSMYSTIKQIKPLIKILEKANILLSKDQSFKESMLWYSNPPIYGRKSEITLKIQI
ncbi:hypothetical protein [Algoriphagus sp.]|uniref:hypothetical protein n=1 Tax=Algoriphagus sp. TaxID=1872435 RepID=UPI00391D9494